MTKARSTEGIEHDAVTLALAKSEKEDHFVGMTELAEAMQKKTLRVQAYALDDPSAPSTTGTSSISNSTPNVTVKVCHFVRHGQGFHNLMADMAKAQGKEWTQFENTPNNPYVMPEILDAPLTHKGRNQARAAQPIVQNLDDPLELVVSSSHCRALQTSLIAFEHLLPTPVPFLALESVRETTGVHLCDKRRPKSQQMVDFPRFNFDLIADEEDTIFRDDRRESRIEIGSRIYQFLEWLSERDETQIGVASHSGWLLTFFNGAVESKSESLKSWFHTGELRSVKLVFEKYDC